jgi:superfamily II DNA/RNA helicase
MNSHSSATSDAQDAPAFSPFDLVPCLKQSIAQLGFTQPTPVQAAVWDAWQQALPNPLDLMVSSETGSGKTLAFLLPILQDIEVRRAERIAAEKAERQRQKELAQADGKPAKRRNPYNPRHFQTPKPVALVLCPTRELAQQVANDAIDLVRAGKGPRVASVVGGMPYGLQMTRLQNVDLVVATPGRLLDLNASGSLDLSAVTHLVLDEADRMLDLGFSEDLARIHEITKNRTCTLMFSATFDPPIERLGQNLAPQSLRLQLQAKHQSNVNIEQRLYWADDENHRGRILEHWMRDPSIDQAIIFTGTQLGCDELAQALRDDGFPAEALHGAMSQALRNRRLMALRRGNLKFLVATDVAARGIDVPTITHVFNHGLPMKSEDYVHRIGRTGRAGRQGLAVTIALHREFRKIRDIEYYQGSPLPESVVEGMEPVRKPMGNKPKRGAPSRPGSRRDGGGGGKARSWSSKPSGDRFHKEAHGASGAPKRGEHGASAKPRSKPAGHGTNAPSRGKKPFAHGARKAKVS